MIERGSGIGEHPHEVACKRLWASVMLRALDDYWDKHHRDSAAYWLDDTRTHPGSFLWLCDLFDLDPVRTRGLFRVRTGVSMLRKMVEAQGKTRRELERVYG